jgi:TRAP-type C4-dicarboxylate transport system permease small subunit
MASGPPPGLDLTADASGTVIGPVIALLVVSTIAVVLRITSRYIAGQQLLWDDYLAVLALIFAIGTGALSILGKMAGQTVSF